MQNTNLQKATFGAGCFWGVEAAFSQVKGVNSTAVGYSGGPCGATKRARMQIE